MKKFVKAVSTLLVSALCISALPAATAMADDDIPILISARVKVVTLAPQCAKSAASSLTALNLKVGAPGYDLKFYGVPDYKQQVKNGTLKWVSSDSTVATVDKSGVVTAISAGECEISLQVGTGEYCCVPVTVTVTDPSAAVVTPTSTPTPAPSETPTVTPEITPVPESEVGIVLYDTFSKYKDNDKKYKFLVKCIAPLRVDGFRPETDSEWADFIRTRYSITVYDPFTKKEYTADADNAFPAGWVIHVDRNIPSSNVVNNIELFVPTPNGAYTYFKLPIEKYIDFTGVVYN